MKTFKLISIQIVEDDALVDIEMEDGLIINKEDENRTWLVEVFTDQKYIPYFQEAYDNDKEIVVQVVITKKENDPAAFKTKVCAVKELKNNHVSILLTGHLTKPRGDYPELLLEHLIEQGLTGEQLLDEFKEKMVSRPKVPVAKKI
ncbi:YwpF-like family protein [Bacillus sp. REN3]|uniref:YwpF-like family protein n=1 Tax=Bacillus sp. REN3 TaxID=2802440 RepID=UPI001AEEECDA|nr:YwpF-like family protein [Bacillus sp. REN3]